jgi:hypothetical protein
MSNDAANKAFPNVRSFIWAVSYVTMGHLGWRSQGVAACHSPMRLFEQRLERRIICLDCPENHLEIANPALSAGFLISTPLFMTTASV